MDPRVEVLARNLLVLLDLQPGRETIHRGSHRFRGAGACPHHRGVPHGGGTAL